MRLTAAVVDVSKRNTHTYTHIYRELYTKLMASFNGAFVRIRDLVRGLSDFAFHRHVPLKRQQITGLMTF